MPIGYIALSGPQLKVLAEAANIHGRTNSAGLVTTMELVPWESRGRDVAGIGGWARTGATEPKITELPSLSFRLRIVAALPPSVWDFSSPCPDGFKAMELNILGALERVSALCFSRSVLSYPPTLPYPTLPFLRLSQPARPYPVPTPLGSVTLIASCPGEELKLGARL